MPSNIFSARYIVLLVLVLVVSTVGSHLLLSPSQANNHDFLIDEALGYSINGNHAKAVSSLIPLAEQGVDRAKLYLGVAYYHGNGVAKNIDKSKTLFFELQENNFEPGIVSTYLNLIGSLPVE